MKLSGALIEASEQELAEEEGPDAIVDVFEPDIFAREAMRERERATLPKDASVGPDAAAFEVAGIRQWRQTGGIRPRGRAVERGGGFLSEALVGSLVVELGAKAVEATLLRRTIALGGAGSWRL